jgi:hypothetical protein
MLQYILILVAAMAAVGGPAMDALTSAGPAMDYVVAFGIALMLKPWLEGHFE